MSIVNCFELPHINFCLIDYRQVIRSCERDIINDLFDLGLLTNLNMTKPDTKKVIYHHMIHNVCETVMSVKTNNKIVLYDNLNNIQLELFDHSTRTQVINFINTLTRKIKTLLPVKIYTHEDDYDVFVDRCTESSAELRARAVMIEHFLHKHSQRKYDFEKITKFVDKFELTYLSQQYFNKMKVKNLMFV